MGNIIQNLRGSVAEHSTYTGKKGVISLVTDNSAGRVPTGEIRIHDESTAGGLPISLSNGVTLKQSSIVTTNGAAYYDIAIPSVVKYITAMVLNMTVVGSQNQATSSDIVFRLGTSTGVKTSGYSSSGGYITGGAAIEADTQGFKIYNSTWSDTLQNFMADFYLFDNTRWIMKGQGNYVNAAQNNHSISSGFVTLDGPVTTIRLANFDNSTGNINTVRNFDGGEFRVMYA